MTRPGLLVAINHLPAIDSLLGLWVHDRERTKESGSQAKRYAAATVGIPRPLLWVVLRAKTNGVEFEERSDLLKVFFVDEFLAEKTCQVIASSDSSLQQRTGHVEAERQFFAVVHVIDAGEPELL